MNNEPVSRRTRSKAPIKSTSERGNRAQLRAGAVGRIGRSSNDASTPAKRRKTEGKSTNNEMKAKNGKVLNQSLVTNLQQMPDDMLTKIVHFLTASDGNYLYSDRTFTEDDVKDSYSYLFEDWYRSREGEESVSDSINRIINLSNVRYSTKKLSSPPSVPVASLGGLALLLRSASRVSKRFNRFCDCFLTEILIDADFFGISFGHELGCTLWMIKKRLNLSRIRAKPDYDTAHLLATLLVHCNTTELRACDVKFLGQSFIRTAWLSKFQAEEVDLISETTRLSSKSQNEFLWDLGVSRVDYLHAEMSEDDFFKVVAVECPSIELLTITMEIDPYETRLDSRYASLMSSPSLKYIDVSIRLPKHFKRRRSEVSAEPVLLYSGLTKAISLASNLRGLRLGPTPYINDKYGLKIESESLELIDTVEISKNTFVLKCKCPNLQHFICNGEGYASGLLPEGFDVTQRYWNPRWTDDSLPASAGFFGLEAHHDCIVHLKGYRALRL